MKEYHHSLVAVGTFRGCSLETPFSSTQSPYTGTNSMVAVVGGWGGGRPGRHREIDRNVINLQKYFHDQQQRSSFKAAFQFHYRNVT